MHMKCGFFKSTPCNKNILAHCFWLAIAKDKEILLQIKPYSPNMPNFFSTTTWTTFASLQYTNIHQFHLEKINDALLHWLLFQTFTTCYYFFSKCESLQSHLTHFYFGFCFQLPSLIATFSPNARALSLFTIWHQIASMKMDAKSCFKFHRITL
jgi:hypothetical protein